jgi:hypothetical protein
MLAVTEEIFGFDYFYIVEVIPNLLCSRLKYTIVKKKSGLWHNIDKM